MWRFIQTGEGLCENSACCRRVIGTGSDRFGLQFVKRRRQQYDINSGTLEIVKNGVADGQSSIAETDIDSTPEFESGLAAHELPPSDVDSGGTVMCG